MQGYKKILHLCVKGLSKPPVPFYNTDWKLSAGLAQNGHFVYDLSLRDFARKSTPLNSQKWGKKAANVEIINVVKNIQPDLLLIGHIDFIEPAILAEVKKIQPNIKIALWYVDILVDFKDKNFNHIQKYLPYLDTVFVTTGGKTLKQAFDGKVTRAYFPNIVHAAIDQHQSFANNNWQYQFMFCGSIGDDTERLNFMQRLQHGLVDYKTLFAGVFSPALKGGDYMQTIGKVQLGLNYSRRNDISLYSSDRIAQLTGNGLMVLTPKIPDFEILFNAQEVVYFDDEADLIDKAKYYINYPEQSRTIAQAGWQKAHQSFNAARVSQFMLETIFDEPYTENYEWLAHVFKAEK